MLQNGPYRDEGLGRGQDLIEPFALCPALEPSGYVVERPNAHEKSRNGKPVARSAVSLQQTPDRPNLFCPERPSCRKQPVWRSPETVVPSKISSSG